VPVVAFAAASPLEPYGAFLRGIGCGVAHTVANDGEYVRRALALAAGPDAPMPDPVTCDAAAFARALDGHITRAFAEEPIR
jgi:hypothetical protein